MYVCIHIYICVCGGWWLVAGGWWLVAGGWKAGEWVAVVKGKEVRQSQNYKKLFYV